MALYGFRDSNAWEVRGNRVVGRARDSTYKEKLRSGIPIEYFFELETISPEVSVCSIPRTEAICIQMSEEDAVDYWDFEYNAAKKVPVKNKKQKKQKKHNPKEHKVAKPSTLTDVDDTEWVEFCDNILWNVIWWKTLLPFSYRSKYPDSVWRSFQSRLDPEIHITRDDICDEWKTFTYRLDGEIQ